MPSQIHAAVLRNCDRLHIPGKGRGKMVKGLGPAEANLIRGSQVFEESCSSSASVTPGTPRLLGTQLKRAGALFQTHVKSWDDTAALQRPPCPGAAPGERSPGALSALSRGCSRSRSLPRYPSAPPGPPRTPMPLVASPNSEPSSEPRSDMAAASPSL